jgi:hypothetical protein
MTRSKDTASNESTQVVRFPDAIEQWAAQAERHALDPYLEDVQAQIEQGITDPADDRSVRVVLCPPNERSAGRSVLSVIGSVREAVKETAEKINKGGLYVEPVIIRRPSADAMAQIVTRMHAALPSLSPETDGELRQAPALPPPTNAASLPGGSEEEPIAPLPARHASEVPLAPLPPEYARNASRASVAPHQAPWEPPSRTPVDPRVEPQPGRPFVLRIREGRATVDEAGPFAKIADAIEARNARGASGQVATIYEGARVAEYHGRRAVFSFGRTKWSRADG